MAIGYDAGTGFNSGATSSSTHSYNHTVASGATLLVVVVNNGANRTISGVTYNSVAMTKQLDNTNSSYFRSSIWTLANPASGTNAVAITLSGTAICASAASSWTGTATVTPVGVTGSYNDGTGVVTPTVTVTTTQNNSVLVDGILVNHNSTGITKEAAQTLIYTVYNTTDGWNVGSSYKATTTAGSYSMSWTASIGADAECMNVIEILPAPAVPANASFLFNMI